MIEALEKSTWQIPAGRVSTILKSMGINFRGTGHSFWVTNQDELEYIYHEFEKKIRELKSLYHPDRTGTGDAEKYRQLVDADDLVQRQFEQHGAIKISAAQREERRELREARSNARRNYHEEMVKAGKIVRKKRVLPYRPRQESLDSSDLLILNPDELYRRRKAREKAQWRLDVGNREKERERNRAWRAKHVPTEAQKEHRKAYFRAYRKRPERLVKEYRDKLAYRKAHPEKVRQWKKNYREKHGVQPRKRPSCEGARIIKGTPAYERRAESRRDHYDRNREKINAQQRERYLAKQIAARCKQANLLAAA